MSPFYRKFEKTKHNNRYQFFEETHSDWLQEEVKIVLDFEQFLETRGTAGKLNSAGYSSMGAYGHKYCGGLCMRRQILKKFTINVT